VFIAEGPAARLALLFGTLFDTQLDTLFVPQNDHILGAKSQIVSTPLSRGNFLRK
jgi:hypothetical protein